LETVKTQSSPLFEVPPTACHFFPKQLFGTWKSSLPKPGLEALSSWDSLAPIHILHSLQQDELERVIALWRRCSDMSAKVLVLERLHTWECE
jgi:hypothetical protein